MSNTETPRLQSLELGSFPLSHNKILPRARLSYRSWGKLNVKRDNAVLIPSYYTGSSASQASMIGAGKALDPEAYFIIATDLFGNGNSTSPSHAATAQARATYPLVSINDNVRAQAMLADELGVQRFALVYGWSMGAMQAWAWAAHFPDRVRAILPVCGAARCWPGNRAFLEGVRAALTADPVWAGGAYTKPPEAGLRAFGRAYCGWAYSAGFFREERWREKGFLTLEDFLKDWEDDHLGHEAADLIAVLDTWAGTNPGANLTQVRARVIAMPCDQDRYFTLEENALEVAQVQSAELRPIFSNLGHAAGAPGRWARETAQVERAIAELLSSAAD